MFSLRAFSVRRFDWVLLLAVLLLVTLGLAAIYSVDLSRGQELAYFRRQLLSAGIGITLLVAASLTQYTLFRSSAKLFYAVSLALLAVVMLVGKEVNGTRGWFRFGGFSLQPIEVAKVGIIFILAYVVYHYGRRYKQPLFFFGTGIITLLVIGLIMLEPDLGSAVIIGAVWFGIMLLVGARPLYIFSFIGTGLLFAVIAWFAFLQPYQRNRILVFINPGSKDAIKASYNITQATIAVGAGQWFGRGLGKGSQSQLRFLPEAQTDFIFTVIAEELGLAGVTVFLVLFGAVLWRLTVIVRRSHDDFVAITVSGIVLLLFCQFFVNVGANVGLLPITGVPLPFVSYGGSSLIVSLFLIGVAESMVGKKY